MEKKIILASQSPRRKELLQQIGISFCVHPSKIQEVITKVSPDEVVRELAAQKALDVASCYREGVVLGADTVVVLDGKIMGKPKDESEAFEMLQKLQGKTHQVYTGVAIIEKTDGEIRKQKSFTEQTEVTMYPVTDEEIRRHIATGEPMDKAGAYAIQGKSAVFIREIRGDYNNVVGLPVARIYQELKA